MIDYEIGDGPGVLEVHDGELAIGPGARLALDGERNGSVVVVPRRYGCPADLEPAAIAVGESERQNKIDRGQARD